MAKLNATAGLSVLSGSPKAKNGAARAPGLPEQIPNCKGPAKAHSQSESAEHSLAA